MKLKYKYIHFEKGRVKTEWEYWYVLKNSSNATLGTVECYPSRKRYCFMSREYTVLDKRCLLDIIDFIKQLERRT